MKIFKEEILDSIYNKLTKIIRIKNQSHNGQSNLKKLYYFNQNYQTAISINFKFSNFRKIKFCSYE